MTHELTYIESKAVNSLIRKSCCNYKDGTCLYERPCKQFDAASINCKWFEECVLPSDKSLQAQLDPEASSANGYLSKPCAVCGNSFLPNSNRAKYCPVCARQIRREQKASSARANPERQKHLEDQIINQITIKSPLKRALDTVRINLSHPNF